MIEQRPLNTKSRMRQRRQRRTRKS